MCILLRLALLLSFAAGSLTAHSMSMSNGELALHGDEAVLAIRVPDYEVQQLPDAQQALLDAFTLRADGQEMERTAGGCTPNEAEGSYNCVSRFAWPQGAAVVEVECDLPDAVAPNHVHVLRAVSPEGAEQQVFDYATRKRTFRRRPSCWATPRRIGSARDWKRRSAGTWTFSAPADRARPARS